MRDCDSTSVSAHDDTAIIRVTQIEWDCGLEDPPAVAAASTYRKSVALASRLDECLKSYKTGTDSVHDKASICAN
jgi:hypothetical protein